MWESLARLNGEDACASLATIGPKAGNSLAWPETSSFPLGRTLESETFLHSTFQTHFPYFLLFAPQNAGNKAKIGSPSIGYQRRRGAGLKCS